MEKNLRDKFEQILNSSPEQTQEHHIVRPRSYQSSKEENIKKSSALDIQKILLIILVAGLICYLILKHTNCLPSNFQNQFPSYDFFEEQSSKNDSKKIDLHEDEEQTRYSDPLFQEF